GAAEEDVRVRAEGPSGGLDLADREPAVAAAVHGVQPQGGLAPGCRGELGQEGRLVGAGRAVEEVSAGQSAAIRGVYPPQERGNTDAPGDPDLAGTSQGVVEHAVRAFQGGRETFAQVGVKAAGVAPQCPDGKAQGAVGPGPGDAERVF